MKRLFLLFIPIVLLAISCSAPGSIRVKSILDATKFAKTPDQFSAYMEKFDYCLVKNGRETVSFYAHFKCGENSIGASGLRVNFAVSNDGQLNSSFLTKNEGHIKKYEKELEKYNFKEIPDPAPENPRENASWYASENYEGVVVLWEYFLDDESNKVWHIGFVWNKSRG